MYLKLIRQQVLLQYYLLFTEAQDINDFMNYEADFRLISDTAGFILVYPQALEDPNDGNSTSWMHKEAN